MKLIHARDFCVALIITTIALTPLAVASDPGEQRIDFEFAGGTLPEYIDAIREHAPDLNVAITPGGELINMPAMSVRNVRGSTLVNLIRPVGESPSNVQIVQGLTDDVHVIRINDYRQDDQRNDAPQHLTRIFALSDFVGTGGFGSEQSVEEVLRGIEMVLETTAAGEDQDIPELRFHEPTALLTVRGTYSQTERVAQTITELRKAAEHRRGWAETIFVTSPDDEVVQSLQEQVRQLQEENRRLREQLAALSSEPADE